MVLQFREQRQRKAPLGYIRANLVGPKLTMLYGTIDTALQQGCGFSVSHETARQESSNETLAVGRPVPKDLSRSQFSLLDNLPRGNEIAAQGQEG